MHSNLKGKNRLNDRCRLVYWPSRRVAIWRTHGQREGIGDLIRRFAGKWHFFYSATQDYSPKRL